MLESLFSLGITVWHMACGTGQPFPSRACTTWQRKAGASVPAGGALLRTSRLKGGTGDQIWSLLAKGAQYISHTGHSLPVLLPKWKGCLFRNLGIQKSISSQTSENLGTYEHISGTEKQVDST